MLPVIQLGRVNMPPAVQEGNYDFLQQFFGTCFSGFAPQGRYLKARKLDFLLTEGGAQTIIQHDKLFAVLLGVNPYNHCVYYERDYQVGQEPAKPDLVWLQKTADDFPDALPVQYRQKILRNGRMMWAFKQARRTVWALCVPDGQTGSSLQVDVDNPVVFDISSMSLYGAGDPATYSFKWSGMRAFCQSLSQPGVMVTPSMFVTHIVLDAKSQVSGVVMFNPCDGKGNPLWLDDATFNRVIEAARSPLVESLLEVHEIGPEEGAASESPEPATVNIVATETSSIPAPAQVAPPDPAPVAQPQPQPQPQQPSAGDSLLARASAVLGRAPLNTEESEASSKIHELIDRLGL